ncbi:MAG: Nramp family divalent metal transporter [Pseudomonadota bacterium]
MSFSWFSKSKNRFIFFLGIIGPGIITANVDNDAGGIATYSLAGAHFGYSLLWSLLPITLLLIMVQEMVARMGVVTGKGLSDLIREEFGVRTTMILMLALLITNLGNTMAEFAGLAASLEIFGVNKYLSVPIGAFLVWWLVVKGSYRSVEKIFLVACGIYTSYIISGFMAKPDWTRVFSETVLPTFHWDRNYLLMVVGIIGTTIAPWMQFYQQSAVVEKGIPIEGYRLARWDVIVGCLFAVVVAFFIVISCGATLHVNRIEIQTAEDAARALAPLAGKYASRLFALGLANASLFAASILPLSTAFYICEALGWEAGVNKTFKEAPQFMWLYSGMVVLGGATILIPNIPLILIMLLSQVLNGILLPFILIYILILINKKKLMGDYVNGRFFNLVSWGAVGILIIITLLLIWATVHQL